MVEFLFPVIFLDGVKDDPFAKCILRDGHPFYFQRPKRFLKNDHPRDDNIRPCRIKPVNAGTIVRVVLLENQLRYFGNFAA